MTFGVVINQLEGSFFSAQWRVLAEWGRSRGVRLIYFTGKALESTLPMEKQHNSIYSLIDPARLDGLLVFSGSLGNLVSPAVLREVMEPWGRIPLVTVNSRVASYPSIHTDSTDAISDLVEHITVYHGLGEVGIVAGEPTNPEAAERLDQLLASLENRGVSPGDVRIFHGDFSSASGTLAAEHFLETGVPQAILCCNDEMAHSLILRLQSSGVFVPEDTAVTGFDGLPFGQNIFPALTTVELPHRETTIRSMEILLDLASGAGTRSWAGYPGTQSPAPCRLVIRQSCGCLDYLSDQAEAAGGSETRGCLEEDNTNPGAESRRIRDSMGKGHPLPALHQPVLDGFRSLETTTDPEARSCILKQLRRHYFMNVKAAGQIQYAVTHDLFLFEWKFRTASRAISSNLYLEGLLETLKTSIPYLGISLFRLYLYNQPILWPQDGVVDRAAGRLSRPPADSLVLHLEMQGDACTVFSPGGEIKPIHHIYQPWPAYARGGSDPGPGVVVKPLFFGEVQMGLFVMSAEKEPDMLFESLREVLSISLEHIHINRQMQEARRRLEASLAESSALNKTLQHISVHDELTGLLNRRGFFQLAQKIMETQPAGEEMYLFYLDMDGLKQINDRFGHNTGDTAITEFATALRACFRANDLICRMGGDEFTVLARSGNPDYPSQIRSRLKTELERRSAEGNLSFTLSASLGYQPFRIRPEVNIEQILRQADAGLYREKQKRKD
ncbi:diguanylate cyclase [Spirochaeta lutea]|nr:diguanylate cyclase [Spirochaeta lutea]